MSLLDRYLDTEKYQGEIRPLPKALFYQRFGKHELWMTNMEPLLLHEFTQVKLQKA